MSPAKHRLELSVLAKTFAICKLAAEALLPGWAMCGEFCSATRSSEELSLVVEREFVPAELRPHEIHRVLKVHGPFALSETGVLAALVAPLAEAKVSVFTISTFNTDYLLVNYEQLQSCVTALRSAGHEVHEVE
jgi:hypothetical protein